MDKHEQKETDRRLWNLQKYLKYQLDAGVKQREEQPPLGINRDGCVDDLPYLCRQTRHNETVSSFVPIGSWRTVLTERVQMERADPGICDEQVIVELRGWS